jgi:hypothetical protein
MGTESMHVDLTESDSEELRLLYNVSVADIAFFKQQQWAVTNHALVLHGAFLFIAYQVLVSPLQTWQLWLLIVLTWAVCIAGLGMVNRLQGSILGRRTRLERVRGHFGKPFNDAWTIQKPKDDVHQLLFAVMLLSSGVVTWLVLVKS